MGKLKTRKSLAKRVKLTKGGILLRRKQNIRHLKLAKSGGQKRRGQKELTFSKAFAKKFKTMI